MCFTIITAELDNELELEESTESDDTAEEEVSIPLNAEEIVANGLAAGIISDACDVLMDTEEERLIHKFVQHGCTWDHGYDKTAQLAMIWPGLARHGSSLRMRI